MPVDGVQMTRLAKDGKFIGGEKHWKK